MKWTEREMYKIWESKWLNPPDKDKVPEVECWNCKHKYYTPDPEIDVCPECEADTREYANVKCVTSDGEFTIGYIDSLPAMWPGDMNPSPDFDDPHFVSLYHEEDQEEAYFGDINGIEWSVENGEWVED